MDFQSREASTDLEQRDGVVGVQIERHKADSDRGREAEPERLVLNDDGEGTSQGSLAYHLPGGPVWRLRCD